MRKGIGANNGLIGLDIHAGDLCDQPAAPHYFLGPDVSIGVEYIVTRSQRHNNLFHRTVACPLSDTIECAFDLPCPVKDR